MSREIPRLSTLILKDIAKNPTKYLSNKRYEKAINMFPSVATEMDITQVLIDYITEAGRLVDDIIPITYFKSTRTTITLKNTKLTPKFIIKVIDQCPLLIEIDLSGTFHVDDELVHVILLKCSRIQKLNIRNCRKITYTALDHIIQKKTTILTSLNIGGDLNISEDGIYQFIKSPVTSQLTELYLSGLAVNDKLLQLLSKQCKHLKKVGLNYSNVTERVLREFLISIGSNMQVLHMAWIGSPGIAYPVDNNDKTHFSPEFFTEFLSRTCPCIVELDVSGLKSITEKVLQQYFDDLSVVAQGNFGLKCLKAKFVGSSKQVLEQFFLNYNDINVEL